MTIGELRNKRLRMYLRAEEMILAGAQSYSVEGRELTRADLKEIRAAIEGLIASGAYLDESERPGRVKLVIL